MLRKIRASLAARRARRIPFAAAFALGVIAGMIRAEIAEAEHWAPWIAEACSPEAARIANAMAMRRAIG